MSWLSDLVHHPKGFVQDVTGFAEKTIPGAKQIDQFLNKAGIGPADLFNNPFKPQGWAGDIEHGFSQATHDPGVRTALEIAAALAAAYFGGEALLPEIMGSTEGAGAAVTAEDLAAMSAEGGADLSAAAGATEAATAADIAAGTAGTAGATAGTAAAAAPEAAAAAQAAAAVPGAMPEVLVSGQVIPAAAAGGGFQSALFPGATLLAANQMVNPQQYTGRTPQVKAQGADNPQATPDGTAAVPGVDMSLVAGPGGATSVPDVLTPEMGATPITAPTVGGPMGTELDDAGLSATDTSVGTGPSQPGFGQQMWQYLKTPKGMLTAGMLGMSGLSALSKAKLPGAAQQAGNIAGPAAAQAQGIISSGGYSAPQWSQQKASIDAQIDQEVADASRAMQQNAQNSGMGGQNSDVVQQQLAGIRERAETQRQMLYAQALQQNVNNAVAELTGADQTLMGIADLQYNQSAQAKVLAAQLAQDAAWLNIASSPSVPVGG